MMIIWCFAIMLSCSLQGFCNGKEIFVSPLGRNTLNCTTIDNPCLEIQYATSKVAISNDVIKLDGSHGKFSTYYDVDIECMNLTFTSYNGVAWVYGYNWNWNGYNVFLNLNYLNKITKYTILVHTVNFHGTILVASNHLYSIPEEIAIALTVKNCHFEFSKAGLHSHIPQPLIHISKQYSFITVEKCAIRANHKIGILKYSIDHDCTTFKSTKVTFSKTKIENAVYTVDALMKACSDALPERSFNLIIVNSLLQSKGKCQSQTAQVRLSTGKPWSKVLLSVNMKNSRFENLSVLAKTAPVMDIQGQSTVYIANCLFKGNAGYRGGALSLQLSDIRIHDSQFYDNQARVITTCAHRDQGGSGGAIFVDGSGLILKIYNSSFINNIASCFGSAVYLEYSVTIVVKQTQFSTLFTSPSNTIWFSYSYSLRIAQVSFQSSIAGRIFFANAETFTFGERTPYFKCPIGSIINISEPLVRNSGKMKSKIVKCQFCRKGSFTLMPNNISGFKETNNIQNRHQAQCQSCIFGADCKRGIKPRPNFWGYVHKSKAYMIVCPPGYCCQIPKQCSALQSCDSRRTGRLCGKCKHGHFQSFFTNECLENTVCKTENFWTLAIVMCLLFTIIFIFLQDIFLFVVKRLRFDKIVSVIKRRIDLLRNELHCKKRDCGRDGGNERKVLDSSINIPNDDRKEETVCKNDEMVIHGSKTESNNSSMAGGLIKIIFLFYQLHSVLTVYISNRKIQYFKEMRVLMLSIFNLNAQIPIRREFHCPFHGIDSTTKVWIKALFPVNCLILATFLYAFVAVLSSCLSSSNYIKKYSIKIKVRLLNGILQLILLGYATLTSSILSLVTCISLVTGERILYIDGTVPCYQQWQYAILIFIALWAIPLIYALHKLPRYMRNGEISVRGVYTALLLPLPFVIYTMVKNAKWMRCCKGCDSASHEFLTYSIPYVRMHESKMMSQLLNVIEGPFRYKTSSKEMKKLSWEPILLLQRLLLALCHTFVLEPGMRSLLLLLFIIIFAIVNSRYQPFGNGFLNITSGITFIMLCITGIINAIYAVVYEYGRVPKGPLVELLTIFDYVEVIMVLIFPVVAVAIILVLVSAKVFVFVGSICAFIIASCKRCRPQNE